MAGEESIIGFLEICQEPTRRLDIAVGDLDEEYRDLVLAALGEGEQHGMVVDPDVTQFHCPSTGYWYLPEVPPFCPGCGQKQAVQIEPVVDKERGA